MLYLITGEPGAGKTLRAVWRIQKLVKEGRPVFSNIEGLKLPGVQAMPEDWRECPDGSVIAIDEIQNIWGADTGKGRSRNEQVQALETHRHRDIDIIMTTQHPSLIHVHVRRLVGHHEHIVRQLGLQKVKIHMMERCFDPLRTQDLAMSHMEWFNYPRSLFSVYKSAEIHTHKFHIPRAVRWLLVFGICLIALVIYASGGFVRVWQGKPAVTAQQHQQRSKPVSSVSQAPHGGGTTGTSAARPVVPPAVSSPAPYPVLDTVAVGGCIMSAAHYGCWDVQGRPVKVPAEFAADLLAGGVGRQLVRSGGGGVYDSQPQPAPTPAPALGSFP